MSGWSAISSAKCCIAVTEASLGRKLHDRTGGATIGVIATIIAGGIAAAPFYAGTLAPYLLFQTACVLFAAAAFLRPVSYGFYALAIFFLLGFWLKLVGASFGADVLIEPLGDFTGSPESWDRGVLLAAAGLTGATLPRLLLHVRSRVAGEECDELRVPAWFARARTAVWGLTGMLLAAGTLANWKFRFYAVGLQELVILPFPFNAALAWWYTVGVGIWLAALLEWERRLNGNLRFSRWLLIPLAEAVVGTVVMLSRGFFLMKTLPYVLALGQTRIRRRLHVRPAALAALLVMMIGGFALSLAAVSWLRVTIYPVSSGSVSMPETTPTEPRPPVRPSGRAGAGEFERASRPSATEMREQMAELGRMVIGRWIGLEGVLVLSVVPGHGANLFRTGLVENPSVGNSALYQQLSRAPYSARDGFIFLTVPGVVAVLAYSGSYVIVLLGMMLVTSLLLATEAVSRRLFQNEFLCAVVGVAMANALAQMNFPYLTMVFFLELWGTLIVLWLLSVAGTPGVSAPGAQTRLD